MEIDPETGLVFHEVVAIDGSGSVIFSEKFNNKDDVAAITDAILGRPKKFSIGLTVVPGQEAYVLTPEFHTDD